MSVSAFLLAAGCCAAHGKGEGFSLSTLLAGIGVMMVILFVLAVVSIMGSHYPETIRRFASLFRRTGRAGD